MGGRTRGFPFEPHKLCVPGISPSPRRYWRACVPRDFYRVNLKQLQKKMDELELKGLTEVEMQALRRRLYFGAELSDRRKRSGLTQEKLASTVGVSRAHLGRIESGGEPVSDQLLHKLLPKLRWPRDKAYATLGRPAPQASRTALGIIGA